MSRLIVIEGLDGSGKATQSRLLTQRLQAQGVNTRGISFPDYRSPSSSLVKMYLSGEFGSDPRAVNAYAASSFYAVDRYASFKKDWENDWKHGIVIADRYTSSNAIHQCSKLPKEQWDAYLRWLFEYEYRLLGIPTPDLVLYLRVELGVSQKLLFHRSRDRDARDIHERDLDYLARCQEAAAYCAERLGWDTIECARNGEMRAIQDIHEEILSHIIARFEEWGAGYES